MRRKRLASIGFFARGLGISALIAGALMSAHHATAPPAPDWLPQHDERLRVASAEHPLASGAHAWASLQSLHANSPSVIRTESAATISYPSVTFPIDRARLSNDETTARLTHSIQSELQRFGCYRGRPHGSWDEPTHAAMTAFVRGIGSPMPVTGPQYAMLTLLQGRAHSGATSPCVAQNVAPVRASTATTRTAATAPEIGPATVGAPDLAAAAPSRQEASAITPSPMIIVAPPPAVSVGEAPSLPVVPKAAAQTPASSPISTAELKRGQLHLDRAVADPPSLAANNMQQPRIAASAGARKDMRNGRATGLAAKGESAELRQMWLELRRGAP
jgi:Putative peptidoglycan binding domain